MKNPLFKNQKQRILAVFFLLTFLNTFVPYNVIYANNGGPNAPEAASFEPVDATDMVNLNTGGFTYVLPLMNVPSPEGGYPIALAYHGGVAMDQESSWVGLGWNLNPGAINRSVNGYPDDYRHSTIEEYFYDQGGSESFYSLSLGYSQGGVSIGLGLAWGSNQSLSGNVSIGMGVKVGEGNLGVSVSGGTNGNASVGVGYTSSSGLSIGVSASTDGTVGARVGVVDSNGSGFKVGASTDGTYSASISGEKSSNGNSGTLGINFSSRGVGLTLSMSTDVEYKGKSYSSSGSVGIGSHTSFNTTMSQGDYISNQSGFTIPLLIPVPGVGLFSLSFGKRKVKYYASKISRLRALGPLYFNDGLEPVYQSNLRITPGISFNFNDFENNYHLLQPAFMDIYDVPLSENLEFSQSYDIESNNPVFPAYDKFVVQAQGISGNISAKLTDTGSLIRLTKGEHTYDRFGLFIERRARYIGNYESEEYNTYRTKTLGSPNNFNNKPYFSFDNEISTYLNVDNVDFMSIDDAILESDIRKISDSKTINNERIKKSNFVEYFTNSEISSSTIDGFLETNSSGFYRGEGSAIGAYRITAIDGKTYHFSLPVYNKGTITRTYGLVEDNKEEDESYMEKRQFGAYATHWLLTAVTGPDFIDKNANGMPDDNDYGYWVSFDYGKWSDAYVWSPHADEDYIEDIENTDIKTWIKGYKELYYLDKIKTRTHSAIFEKSQDNSNKSLEWVYNSVNHIDGESQNKEDDYNHRFTLPEYPRLKLDRILLFKNEDIAKNGGFDTSQSVVMQFGSSAYTRSFKMNHNVYDKSDNISTDNALKVISLSQNYDLSNNQLTLNNVYFQGKNGVNVIPPYRFNYIEDSSYNYNIEDMNNWGYQKDNPSLWSMNEITTPQGGKILIDYEDHEFKIVNSDIGITGLNRYRSYRRGGISSSRKANIDYFRLNTEQVSGVQNVNYPTTNFDIINGIYPQLRLYWGNYNVVDSFNGYASRNVEEVSFTDFMGDQTALNREASLKGNFKFNYKTTESTEHINIGDVVYIDLLMRFSDVSYPSYITDSDPSLPWFFYQGNAIITDKISENEFVISSNSPGTYYEENSDVPIKNNEEHLQLIIHPSGVLTHSGGIRVASISTTDGIDTYSSEYKYGENEDGLGWVSYLPHSSNVNIEVPYSMEMPAPIPMYEYVTHQSFDSKGIRSSKTEYKFKVMNQRSTDKIKYGDFYEINVNEDESKSNVGSTKTVQINEFEINDNLNCLGQLLSISNFNIHDQLLNKITNEYYEPNELPSKLGIVEESYQSQKKNFEDENNEKWYINSTKRIKYPNILKSSTETKGGVSYTTEFSNFDPISGQAMETHSYSSNGIALKTVSKPAFRFYEEMGSKVDDSSYKNMLSQGFYSINYLKEGDVWKPYGAEVQSWKDWEGNIWRKHENYVWNGGISSDGIYTGFSEPTNAILSDDWKKISENTKYNEYSKLLEMKDVNGNYASTKMCDDDTKTLAVCNAKYEDLYYTGMEYGSEGGITIETANTSVSTNVLATTSHTGSKYIEATSNSSNVLSVNVPETSSHHRDGKYKVSVWVDATSIKANDYPSFTGLSDWTKSETIYAGDWALIVGELVIPESGGNYTLTSGTSSQKFDDFRLYPITSSMTSYVYNEWDELSYIIGDNGLATHYEYNNAGELKKSYVEIIDVNNSDGSVRIEGGFKLTSEHHKNYKY